MNWHFFGQTAPMSPQFLAFFQTFLRIYWDTPLTSDFYEIIIIIIIIMNFYSPVSNTRCHSIGHKMRIARIKIRVDSPGRWERA